MDKDLKKVHTIVALMNAMLLSDTPLDIGTMEEIGEIWKAMDRVEIKLNSYNKIQGERHGKEDSSKEKSYTCSS